MSEGCSERQWGPDERIIILNHAAHVTVYKKNYITRCVQGEKVVQLLIFNDMALLYKLMFS
jgi:hypothetical protein